MTEKSDFPHVDMKLALQDDARISRTFESIGAFIFQFSQLEFTIQVLIGAILRLPEEQLQIITTPYDFRMLCTVAQSLCIHRSPEQAKDIKNLFKRCLSLNDDRVRIAHGVWSDDGKTIIARHVARTSFKAGFHFRRPDELTKLTDTAQALMAEVLFVLRVPKETDNGEEYQWTAPATPSTDLSGKKPMV
jgi:hypothetical protein